MLYQHDVTGLPLDQLERNAGLAGVPLDPFARALVEGVSVDTASLDELITNASKGWSAERLAPLERSILRIAVHELLDWPDIPDAVSINEAVELAKRFCQSGAVAGERHPRSHPRRARRGVVRRVRCRRVPRGCRDAVGADRRGARRRRRAR